MHLFTAPWRSLPSHRTEGLGASGGLHAVLFAVLASLPPPGPAHGEPQLAVTYVTGVPAADGIQDNETSGPSEVVADNPPLANGSSIQGMAIDGIAYDIEKVRRHRDALFPFVTSRLHVLDDILQRFQPSADRLVSPLGRERRTSTKPPLTLTGDEMQRLVDRGWSRRERWRNFREIAALVAKHDPHDGDAAALVRTYLDQNLLQPYFDSQTRDPRYWVMLALAADHGPIIEYVSAFVREHPSSRTTTELLFMLDEFAQASRDAMLVLLSTTPDIHLMLTWEADRDAFALATSLYNDYRDWAQEAGLDSTQALRARFDAVREQILMAIIASTPDGYGAGDARFLLGRIAWDRNDVPGALGWWRDMGPDGRGSYAESAAAITEALRNGDGAAAKISGVLGAEYRRWLTYSAARLDEFGYSLDTF